MGKQQIKQMLCKEICSEIEALDEIELGSNDYKSTVDNIAKLTDKMIEIEKINIEEKARARDYELNLKRVNLEFEEKVKNRMIEESKLEEMKFNRKDQKFKNLITIGSIIIPSIITVWGTFKTLKFEETGTVTTIMGRGFINKLIPKK